MRSCLILDIVDGGSFAMHAEHAEPHLSFRLFTSWKKWKRLEESSRKVSEQLNASERYTPFSCHGRDQLNEPSD